jgi:hypothetical protein
MSTDARIPVSLFLLRLGVFIVMLMWTLDKLINPSHAGAVFERFYAISGLGSTAFLIIGLAELALIAAFLLGVRKTLTYGAVLVLHGISTLSSYQQYLGFDNLLFFAAWPMLAACFVLFYLRDLDTKYTLQQFS